VREATGSSSGAAAAAAFFIAALDAFAARGKACGETCVEGGSPSTSVQSASVALSTCPGPALSTPRATWWKGSFPSGVVSACFHDTVCERAADIKPGGVGMLVAGLCLALGGEPNLRKKKGWLFFAGRGAIPYVCMRSHACMRGGGRGRQRGLVLVFYLFFDFFSGEFYGTVSVLCFTDFLLFSCIFYAAFSAEF
jgi:hypothetical protein